MSEDTNSEMMDANCSEGISPEICKEYLKAYIKLESYATISQAMVLRSMSSSVYQINKKADER